MRILHVIPNAWSGGVMLTRLRESQARAHRVIDFHQRSDFWKGTSDLAELIRDLKPTVIHAHAGVACAAAAIARATTRSTARLIGQIHGWTPDRSESLNQQQMWGFAQTDRVVCSVRAHRNLLVRYGVQKLVLVPWGLPLERWPFRGVQRTLAAPTTPRTRVPRTLPDPVIGFVGRVEPRKGQLDLVRAFARLRRHYSDARLELVGPIADRAYAARVRAAVASEGLKNAVTIAGEVRDVATYVRRWDLFVSLSSDEGQGLAVLEAMALGVPVVARPVGGISDFLVDGRNGFAIKDAETKTAALAMLRASKKAAVLRSVANRARTTVEQHYDWKRTVAAFDRLYRG